MNVRRQCYSNNVIGISASSIAAMIGVGIGVVAVAAFIVVVIWKKMG
jgi:hypothetical protein